MTERQERLAKLAVNLTVSAISIGIMLSIAYPGLRDQLRAGAQWMRWLRWRAWWSTLPAWAREAAIVRGRGPTE